MKTESVKVVSRVGDFVATARVFVSYSTMIGGTFFFTALSATAQVVPSDCLPGSTGPIIGSLSPYGGGMCDLGSLFNEDQGSSGAFAISADGSVIVGSALTEQGTLRAFRWADDGSGMLDLGTLRAGNSGNSYANAVSANGEVIVGASGTDENTNRAFRWTAALGMIDLGTLNASNEGNSTAVDISDDGSVIVGNATADSNETRAFRWIDDGNGMLDLGSLRDDDKGLSFASAVSADGTVIIGHARTNEFGIMRAFRWVDDGAGMVDLGSLRDDNLGNSGAKDVSDDGGVIIGEADTDADEVQAFRWIDDGNGMLNLGSLRSDNMGRSSAEAISGNGLVIIGGAVTDDGAERAFRWVGPESGMLDLGSLRTDNLGDSVAYAISFDGSVIGGNAETDSGSWRAFRWIDDGAGMLDLGSLRADNLGESWVDEISADGTVIVGGAETDDGTYRAFIWRTEMQDRTNMQLSYAVLANDTEIAVAQQQDVSGRLLEETCRAEDGKSCLRASGWLTNTKATAARDIGSRTNAMSNLTFGRGLNGQTTVGGTVSVNGTELKANGFDMPTGIGASVWAEYSRDGLARTGWQAAAAVGLNHESGIITRGRGLQNVMLASGDASIQTLGARATLGYGFLAKDWLITPSATLHQFRTSRSAYSEDGSDFNASYDDLSVRRNAATLALSADRKVGARGTLSLEAGVEHDLSRDRVVLTGTSAVPGMERLSVPSTLRANRTRVALGFGYSHDLANNRSFSGNVLVRKENFGTALQASLGASYEMRF